MADSPFKIAARGKYRWATIAGDGQWGFVSLCHIAKAVRLCHTEDEAKRLAAGKCRAVPCSGNHTVEKFEAGPIPQPVWESRIWEID
jgi:hypothetical protein